MRPAGSGGAPTSAALPLLDNAPRHCLRRGALPLPARRSERDPCYYSDRLLAGGQAELGEGRLFVSEHNKWIQGRDLSSRKQARGGRHDDDQDQSAAERHGIRGTRPNQHAPQKISYRDGTNEADDETGSKRCHALPQEQQRHFRGLSAKRHADGYFMPALLDCVRSESVQTDDRKQ